MSASFLTENDALLHDQLFFGQQKKEMVCIIVCVCVSVPL